MKQIRQVIIEFTDGTRQVIYSAQPLRFPDLPVDEDIDPCWPQKTGTWPHYPGIQPSIID
jgi:hypothetical protein